MLNVDDDNMDWLYDYEQQKTCKSFGTKSCPVNSDVNCDECDWYVDKRVSL